MSNLPRVRADMLLRVTDERNKHAPVVASAYYDAEDPYAVTFVFSVGNGEHISWLFARDLLFQGLQSPTGQGDVKVWPGDLGRSSTFMTLSSPTGQAMFELPTEALNEFLAASWVLVPPGEEYKFVNFDQELTDLLTRESWRGV